MRVGLRIGRLGDAKLHQTARTETLKFADQLHSCYNAGALGSSVGRTSDSRSRGLGFETRTGHLVVGSDFTLPDLSEGRGAAATTPLSEWRLQISLNGINTVSKKKIARRTTEANVRQMCVELSPGI